MVAGTYQGIGKIRGGAVGEEQQAAERRAIENVAARLAQAFAAQADGAEVVRTVQEVYRRFDGSPIRDFVPLLVESAARRELSAVGRRPRRAGSETATATRAARPAGFESVL
jgi:hypothetical protein